MDEMKKMYDIARNSFMLEEKLFKKYMQMRDDLINDLSAKYDSLSDKFKCSKEFEYGFYAGVRLFQSIMLDNFDF